MKWVYKLERKFGRICIPHLMLVIIAGQAMVYLANLLNPDILLLSRFSLNWAAVMHGEVWRLLTFVFIPQSTSPLGLVLTLLFLLSHRQHTGKYLGRFPVQRLLLVRHARGHLGGCAHRLRHQLLHQPVAVFLLLPCSTLIFRCCCSSSSPLR